MMQRGRNLNIYKKRGIHITRDSPRIFFHQFKKQLRCMEGHKLQFTTWRLLLELVEVLVLTKKLGRSSLYGLVS